MHKTLVYIKNVWPFSRTTESRLTLYTKAIERQTHMFPWINTQAAVAHRHVQTSTATMKRIVIVVITLVWMRGQSVSSSECKWRR